jgi:hypothetical protein
MVVVRLCVDGRAEPLCLFDPTAHLINAFLIIRSSFVFCKGGRRWLHACACLMRLECCVTGRESVV